ncbi:hypothetical protein PSGK_20730 [Pseudomonas solani]|uniref:hypothetical protein n=1 Tax=Pseudomonas solani TaxID=2731552 RepID=UPI0035BE275C
MKMTSLACLAGFVLLVQGCASSSEIDTRHLTRFDEYHANLEIAGQRYTLDAYIVMFQKPFYITVQRDDRRPVSIDEAARAAEEYIKPRGCTEPLVRRADLDRSNADKTQWMVGIEC